MAKNKSRVLSLLMAVVMMLSALPTNAFAIELGDIIGGIGDAIGGVTELAELAGKGKLVCEDENHCEHTDACYLVEMVPAEHGEDCYHEHSNPVFLFGTLIDGCDYVGCTEHTHSADNGCPVENCDAHAHGASCCDIEEYSHGLLCYRAKKVCSHGWKVWNCTDSCTVTELVCTKTEHDHENPDHECTVTCGISTEHTHNADCYTCETAEHTHNESCDRSCGLTAGLICEETHEVEQKTLICEKEEHNGDCYFNLDDIKAMFSHIESAEEAAESAYEFGKCWLNGGDCGVSYKLGEVEMNLCEEHFCSVCTRLHKYCDCVEVTFANVGNVADATVIVKIKNGETVPAEKVPAAEVINFHFLGWFDAEENEFSTEAIYTEDITFTAKYQALAEYEKLQHTIEFIKNNFDLGTELGRLITLLSNGAITKETVLENKDEAIRAVEAYLFANQLTGKISREQAAEIVNLMKQGDEYIMMVAEWLWPEDAVMMPTIEEILESVDFEKLSEEIKDLIAEKHGVEFDENWVENNKALADQYIKECLDEVKSITEEQKIIIRDQIENKKAHAAEILNNVRIEIRDQIKAEIARAKDAVNAVLADRELGLKIGKAITKLTGLNADSAAVKGEAMQTALVAAIRMSGLAEDQKNGVIALIESGDNGMARIINWLWPTYTVTFVNGETVVESDVVAYGVLPSFDGETPVKTADAQYTYTFAGWDKDIVAVTGDVTYTAVFTSTVNEYTVIFASEDGTVLQSSTVAYGVVPAFTGETPVKTAGAQYTYTFAGWDKDIVTVTGDVTYTAVFTSAVNEYIVIFANEDGTVLQRSAVAYGEMPAFTSETPVKAATAQHTYTFDGWDKAITAVTGDVTYTATYTAAVNEYTVTFADENGDVLETQTVAYGVLPSFDGKTPVKAADAQYTYTFGGWDQEIVAVTGDVTYTATYTAAVNEYTVTFADENGDVLETQTIAYGVLPSFDGKTPVKAADAQYTYTFGGWDKDIVVVTGDVTYTATYTSTVNEYTVTFVSDDKVLKTVTVKYGKSVGVADAPAATSLYKEGHYFMGWDADTTCVTNDMTVNAIWEIMKFTVTWEDGYGKVLETDTQVPYGTMPEYNGETPVAHEDPRYIFSFACFNPTVSAVTGDVTYRATYVGVDRMYTVIFKDHNGIVIDTVTVKYGAAAEGPEMLRKGYTFIGWSEDVSSVTKDMEVTALYTYEYFKSAKLKINVGKGTPASGSTKGNAFSHWGKIYNVRSYYSYYETYKHDSIMSVTDFDYELTMADAEPRNVKYNGVTYTNGQGSSDNYYVLLDNGTFVSCKAEYHLDYKAEFYNVVTFVVDGVEYKVDVVNGTEAVCPVTPEKKGYVFTGWSEDVSKVNGSMTVTPVFEYEYYDSSKLKINVGNGVPASGSTKDNAFSHWGKIYNVRSYYSYYDYPNYKTDSIMSEDDFDYARTSAEAVPRKVKYNGVTYTNGQGSSDNYYVLLDNGTYVSCKGEYHLDYKASFYNVVTFVVNGVEYKVDVLTGTAAEIPADISYEKEGCNFTGWDKDFSKVTKSMTVTAQWELKTYTVTYLSDGAVVGTETVEYGKRATGSVSATLTKEGHTFTGWDGDISKVTEDMTVNAEWERNTYTVTFWLPTGGSTKINVKHGDKLENFVPKCPAGEEFVHWYNSKGGAKLDFETYVVTGNVSFCAKTKWIRADRDVSLFGKLNGREFFLGTAIFEDAYHARKYSNKVLKADQYDPEKIIMPADLDVITVDGVDYFYGSGDNYYTVEFNTLRSYMMNGYFYRYYGDVTLYHKLVTVYFTVDGNRVARTTLRNIEAGTVLTRELLGLAQGQFLYEEQIVQPGTMSIEIGEHADRFACRDDGTLCMISESNGWYTYECTRCHKIINTGEGDLCGNDVINEKGDHSVIVYGEFGTKKVKLGVGSISDFRAAESFGYVGEIEAKHFDWDNVDLPGFGTIEVDGVTYTYGEGSSANYYTINVNKTLFVEKIDGEYIYTTTVELILFSSVIEISVGANRR